MSHTTEIIIIRCLIRNDYFVIILVLVFYKSLVDTCSHSIDTIIRIQKFLFITCRNESQFYQTARHRCFTQHQESSLMNTLVNSSCSITNCTLNHLRQFYTFLHVCRLYKFKHDIALRRARIEPFIRLFVVFLHRDNRVFPHRHVQVILRPVHTQSIDLKSSCHASSRQGVSMNGDKQVSISLVGNIGTLFQRNEHISRSRINHPYVWTVLLYHPSESQRHIQIDILFFRDCSYGTRIMSSVSGIYHQRKFLVLAERHTNEHRQQQQ